MSDPGCGNLSVMPTMARRAEEKEGWIECVGRATVGPRAWAEPGACRLTRGKPRLHFFRNRSANRAIRGTNIGRSRRLS